MWHAKPTGRYDHLSEEATDNAQEIASMLIDDFGWTLEAAAGAIGNIFFESGLNPWSWQNQNILTQAEARTAGASHGYGLIGWTPARKYQFNNATWDGVVLFPNYDQESYPGYGPNWSDVPGLATDGAAQTQLLATAMQRHSGNIWKTREGHSTIDQFIAINTTPEFAAQEFWWGAEYSAHSESIPQRQAWARDYYDWLVEHGYQPSGGGIIPQIMLFILAGLNKWILKL